MASKFEQLMQSQMDRRQFLLVIVSGFAGIIGLSAILGFFTKNEVDPPKRPGYGRQNYGP